MKKIQTVADVYPAIDELMAELKVIGHFKLADTLYHRMYQVAWSSGSELLEELYDVFAEALLVNDVNFSESLRGQIQRIIDVINNYLASSIDVD